MNLIRRARPVFLQCVHTKADAGSFDVPGLRVQLQAAQILPALQFHRTGQHGAAGGGGGGGGGQTSSAAQITSAYAAPEAALDLAAYSIINV